MLTKQEREATIERIKSYGDSDLPFYKLLFGSRAPYAMQYTEYLKALKDRVIDLCDTSNMVELPLDKDGQVIHIGDTLFDNDGAKITVCSIRFNESINNVVITCEGSDFVCTYSAGNLTRKNPVSVQSISKRMQGVLEDYLFSVDSDLHTELVSIADQLKELAGKDEQ